MIQNEINIRRKLNHPNLMKLISVFEGSSAFYFVSEHIEGISLSDYIEKFGIISTEDSAIILNALINILNYLHENKIIHRDVNPHNIIIKNSDIKEKNIFLTGFWNATFVDSFVYSGIFFGTPGYIAPELFYFFSENLRKEHNFNYNEKSDFFSLGITLYFMLFGDLPYKEKDKKSILKRNQECDFFFRSQTSSYY